MINCNTNRTENVRTTDGYLVLEARHEDYFQKQYTGATITSRRQLTYGRYEARLSMPLGHMLQAWIFTRNRNEVYWAQNSQIYIASFTQHMEVGRSVNFADSYPPWSNLLIVSTDNQSIDVHQFHLFGVEWNQKEVKFFFDDQYSKPILLNQGLLV